MEYKLLLKMNPEELNDEVNKYLSMGWVLYGNPSITGSDSHGLRYSQAVVKK